jgi:hypothetical protein
MKRLVRLCFAAGLALTSVGLVTVSLWAPVSSASGLPSFTDPVGDTVVDGNGDAIVAPRADVVGASAEVRPEGIAFGVRLQEPVDPVNDPNWRRPGTYLSWHVDTDANDNFDYEIRYLTISGHPAGDVGRLGVPASSRQVCTVSTAGFSPEAGYTLVVEPKCLGNPAAFSYRVTAYYATNVNVAIDIAPDRRPVLVAMSAPPVTPSSAPAVTTPAPAPAMTPQATPAPAGAPKVSPKAPSAAPAKPAPARASVPARPAAPAPAPVAAAPAPVAGLATTGPRAEQLARFGAAFLLAGLSLMIATGRVLPVPARR